MVKNAAAARRFFWLAIFSIILETHQVNKTKQEKKTNQKKKKTENQNIPR